MTKANRARLVAFAVVLCLALIFSLALGYILVHADHHCTGEHCPICENITICLQAMLQFGDEWFVLFVVAALSVMIARLVVTAKLLGMVRMTPVLQHNRINC